VNFFFFFPIVGSVIGGLLLLFTVLGSGSAPQQAAGAAMAVGMAVIPYVFARSLQIYSTDQRQKRHEERVRELLERIGDAAGQTKDQ
jgi:hypothetical protein